MHISYTYHNSALFQQFFHDVRVFLDNWMFDW